MKKKKFHDIICLLIKTIPSMWSYMLFKSNIYHIPIIYLHYYNIQIIKEHFAPHILHWIFKENKQPSFCVMNVRKWSLVDFVVVLLQKVNLLKYNCFIEPLYIKKIITWIKW